MIVAIIQARMGSSRLPGKVLLDIEGRPMLGRVVERVRRARRIDQVVVATSTASADDAVAECCQREGVACFRGSEEDVLDRFYQAARHCGADAVVRITADCPLHDPAVIDAVIKTYEESGCDYASNVQRPTYPDGLDVEVFSFASLQRAWSEAHERSEREHVTPYLRASGKFRLASNEHSGGERLAQLRWTVDDEKDLAFVRAVYRAFGSRQEFGLDDILKLLEANPGLQQINASTLRNEGYYLSILREPTPLPPRPRTLERTREYLERARRVIPSQTQTLSKGPTQFVQGVSPAFLSRGKGSHVWDVDGNEYIDYITALGPIILGYDYPAVTQAVVKQAADGASFSLPHYLEVELAERLVELIPCAEMVRFGKNGSDATAGAVRVARAYTGREKIACCGYHGWQDWYIGTTLRHLGVPESTRQLTLPFEYNNLASLEQLFAEHAGQIAAVIMEPVGVVEPADGFLDKVRNLTHRHGAVLIFDEIVTGFRLALGGAQQHYGVTPDLACFGKAMANGFPIAAVVGRRDLMEVFDRVFFSFTFGGEAVSLAAALATIKVMQEEPVFAHLWNQGQRLKDGYNVLARELGLAEWTQCVGLAPRTVMTFQDLNGLAGLLLRSLVQQELIKRSVLFLAGANLSYSHSDGDTEHTLRAYREALRHAARALNSGSPQAFLDGDMVQAVFRRAA